MSDLRREQLEDWVEGRVLLTTKDYPNAADIEMSETDADNSYRVQTAGFWAGVVACFAMTAALIGYVYAYGWVGLLL